MRIAIDARGINWYHGTGIGTYTDNVIRNLLNINKENYYRLYWSDRNWEDFLKYNSNIIMTSKKHTRFFEQNYFNEDLHKANIDIYHVPQNGIGLNLEANCKKIITIHDLIPYVMPETVGTGYLLKFLKEVPSLIQNVDGIITVSEYSKKDILKFFPIDPEKIFVTPLAADGIYKPLDKKQCKEFITKKYNLDKPFILYIGGFSPRKNVKLLINSFLETFPLLKKDYILVIAGARKDLGEYLNKKYSNLSSKIVFTGFIPQEELPIFYNCCEAFVYPSLYEGFGLPPLEAMSCGAPVITSKVTSIPEVVEDNGLLIDPNDPNALEEALVKLLNDETLKQSFSEKGIQQASKFSWEQTAYKTLEAYNKVYNNSM